MVNIVSDIEPIQIVVFKYIVSDLVDAGMSELNLYKLLYLNGRVISNPAFKEN